VYHDYQRLHKLVVDMPYSECIFTSTFNSGNVDLQLLLGVRPLKDDELVIGSIFFDAWTREEYEDEGGHMFVHSDGFIDGFTM